MDQNKQEPSNIHVCTGVSLFTVGLLQIFEYQKGQKSVIPDGICGVESGRRTGLSPGNLFLPVTVIASMLKINFYFKTNSLRRTSGR